MNAQRLAKAQRVRQLLRLCQKEAAGLERVTVRLFAVPVTAERLAALDSDEDLSERLWRNRRERPEVAPRSAGVCSNTLSTAGARSGRAVDLFAASERIDAFAARFGRLQDALADKLLPAWFELAGEPPRPIVEMLDRAERLGLIASADTFLAARKLRNRLVL